MQEFSQYLIDKNMRNNFYWALNPYSKDVGGFMDNWSTFNQTKIDFINRIQPYPTFFKIIENQLSIHFPD